MCYARTVRRGKDKQVQFSLEEHDAGVLLGVVFKRAIVIAPLDKIISKWSL